MKISYFYDLLIFCGLVSLGTGLFFIYGTGTTLATMGGISVFMGALGHWKNKK